MDFGLVSIIDVLEKEPSASPSRVLPWDTTMDSVGPAKANLTPGGQAFQQLKLTADGALLGTPAYMAPEQFVGQAADARTDQFSFCVALFGRCSARARSTADDGRADRQADVGEIKPPPHRNPVRPSLARSCGEGCPSRQTTVIRRWTACWRLARYAHPPTRTVVVSAAAAVAYWWRWPGGHVARTVVSRCARADRAFNGVWRPREWNGSRRAAIELGFRTAGQST